MNKLNVASLTRNSTNEEILAVPGMQEALNSYNPVCFHAEESTGGNKSLFLIQKVKIKGLAQSDSENVSFAAAAFAGENRDRIVRAITTVPKDAPYNAGDVINVAQIVLTRNTNAFRDANAQANLIPSQVVLNPTTGMVSAVQGQPIFEHRQVVVKKADQHVKEHDFTNLRVEGDTDTALEREEVFQMLVNQGVDEMRAANAVQMDFVPAAANTMQGLV